MYYTQNYEKRDISKVLDDFRNATGSLINFLFISRLQHCNTYNIQQGFV